MNRRDFIKISCTTSLVLIPALAVAADALVTSDDPMGKALDYVSQSTVAGNSCANCVQSRGDAGATALACNLFPGKQVSATGLCKAWSKKA